MQGETQKGRQLEKNSNFITPDGQFSAQVPLRQKTSALLDRTHYWTPPVPLIEPQKQTPNSSLRIGVIVGGRLYDGLRFEGEIFPLTPENWQEILLYANLDIVLVESCPVSATGHWYLSHLVQNELHGQILQIVNTARKQSIPTVFWNTQDHLYHNHYTSLTGHFDFIFCSDPLEVEAQRKKGRHAELLLPAVQPALHNPFRTVEHVDAFQINVLFDGWTDLIRLEEKLQLLRDIIPFGLHIIESRGRLLDSKVNDHPDFKPCILGCVTQQSRRMALKYAETVIVFNDTSLTTTKQQWRALESAAFRLPVLYRGNLPKGDVRKHILIEHNSDNEILEHLVDYKNNPLQREKDGHLGWREVFSKHTFSHRLQTICRKINISHDWVEYPPMTVITPTYREDLLPRCIENFDKQNYPNKELIIIFNSNNEIPQIPGVNLNRKEIQILTQPKEIFVGSCLNAGVMVAKGDFCLRLDDDDHYGPHCVSDIMLHQRAMDIDLFGKPTQFFLFEDEKNVYQRPFRLPSLCIIPSDKLDKWNYHVAGNLLGGKRKFFLTSSYIEHSFGAADSSFLYNNHNKKIIYACLDNLNVTIHRNSDEKKHTWRMTKEELLTSCTLLPDITINDIEV